MLAERHGFKESAKDAIGRLREAFFSQFLGFSAQCKTLPIYFTRAECAHAAFKERTEDSIWRSKIPVLLPILRYPRFRAHDAHAFTQRRRTSYWPALKNPFLRAQDAFFRPFLRFSAFQSELLQSVTQFSLPAHAARIMMRKSAMTRIRTCVPHFRI